MTKEFKYFFATVCMIVGLLSLKNCQPKTVERIEFTTDTVIVRDTLILTVPKPEKVYIARIDTVFVPRYDTITRTVTIPIERKEYRTEDYLAVVEGYLPELVSMTLYPQTRYITNTETRSVKKNPHFGVGIQAGYGYSNNGLAPYIGVGIQYNLFTF